LSPVPDDELHWLERRRSEMMNANLEQESSGRNPKTTAMILVKQDTTKLSVPDSVVHRRRLRLCWLRWDVPRFLRLEVLP